ncbi:hypothetical protein DICSQDRAFT_161544 [Dichomitus squalens LYAD-421 SS1]|uniref:F-box domain-containing protein n=1 Tax=Dichomitus squalens (strain LYAD-421) TaxID=732165 RepID=R7T2A5_DICSQ|nr:uncharacterized protein DICSQDRAFT_161544 [Dichomitus squalens LYAD-421 SS1]EJF61387.1 hypothetical protein DICSQDRAFT_161544 [Dichomitus squalens LYAD-421 SS1]
MDGIPILPRLTSVYVTSIFSPLRGRVLSCHNLGCLALIHPSIRGLRLRLSRKGKVDEALHRIMSHIAATAQSLEYFRSMYSPAHLGNPGLLTHFTRIRHVTIDGDIHPSDLRDVAKLSGLRRLSIPLYTSLSSERLVSSSITDLHVEDPWNVLGGFLERAHVPQLRSLHIITESSAKSPLGADASQLLHIVATVFTTLEILSIEWKDDCARRVDAPIRAPYSAGRLADITEPLLPLRALREVSLDFRGYDLEYTSRDVQALSEAWPSLEELRLNFRTAIGPRSGIESLTHLAHNCPHLRILDLPGMDAADDALAAAWTPAASHPNLYGLVIERVVFQGMDEAKMWQFIARQFPKAARRATVGPKNY